MSKEVALMKPVNRKSNFQDFKTFSRKKKHLLWVY